MLLRAISPGPVRLVMGRLPGFGMSGRGLMGEVIELREFRVLPFYAWLERPPSVDLDLEEVRTALAIGHGDVPAAAGLLRISIMRLNRFIRGSPDAQGLIRELNEAVVSRAAAEVIRALFDPAANERRREWGSAKVLTSRVAVDASFAPGGTVAQSSVTLSDGDRRITFRWRQPGEGDDA